MARPYNRIPLLILILMCLLAATGVGATETLPVTTTLFLDFHVEEGQLVLLGDVNGDGFSDVGITHDNLAFVFFGSPVGLSSSNFIVLEAPSSGEDFAYCMAAAGDLNHDGYDDIAVSAPEYDYYNIGRVYVFLGSSSGPSTTHDGFATGTSINQGFGKRIVNAGDLNRDGYDDLVIDAGEDHNWQVWLGNSSGLSGSMALEFGHTETNCYPMGDADADGYDDLFFKATNPTCPSAQIYHGSSSVLDLTPIDCYGEDLNDGQIFHPVGDVDGDGYTDMVLGNSGYHEDYQLWGAVGILSGASAGNAPLTWFHLGSQPDSYPYYNATEYGRQVACAGDFNGDGYGDFAVTDPFYDSPTDRSVGLLDVFLGHQDGPADSPDYQVVGSYGHMELGMALVSGGDLNGDGFGDILYTQHSNNHINVIYGRGQSVGSAWVAASNGMQNDAYLGTEVSFAGDFNADGFGDIAGASFQYDSARGMVEVMEGGVAPFTNWAKTRLYGESIGDRFGYSVAGGSDINNDGYSDLVVGAPNAAGGRGRVYVFRGSASGLLTSPAWVLEADSENDDFGFSVASMGDANGDGYADILVGDPNFDGDLANQGRATLFLGSATGPFPVPAWYWEGAEAQSHAGWSVSFGGDNNLDGFTDLLVGQPGYNGPGELTSRGRVMGFQGGEAGPDGFPDWSFYGTQQDGQLGFSVAWAGDVNNDQYSDILVGTPYQDNGYQSSGSAYLFLGSSSGWLATNAQSIHGDSAYSFLGYDLDGIGDINGDGYEDVGIGEYGLDRVRVYLGSENGLDLGSVVMVSDADFDQQGFSVARAGDLNGDGFADLLTGAPYYSNDFYSHSGAYCVHLGNGKEGLLDTRPFLPRQAMMGQTGVDLGGKLSSTSTGVPISLVGCSPAGRCDVRFQHRTGNTTLPLETVATFSEQWNETIYSSANGQYMNMQVHLPAVSENSLQHWQSRLETDSIYLPHSRWFTPEGTGPSLMHFRGALSTPQANLVVGDLAPTNFYGGGDVVVTFSVTNTGIFPASASNCSVIVDGGAAVLVSAGSLRAGQTVDLSLNVGALAAGDHVVRVEADDTNIVPESNELDNIATLNLNVDVSEHLLVLADGSGDVPTIADAVTLISAGGTIELGDGVFVGTGNRDVVITGQEFILRSVSGHPEACIIDPEGSSSAPHRALNLSAVGTSEVKVQHLTIRGGYNTYGGGVILSGASPRFEDVVFENCSGEAGGAVFAIGNSGPVFIDCRFQNNSTTDSGGALGLNSSSAQLLGCVFEGNYSTYGGGGVYIYSSMVLFDLCVFNGNNCGSMGGAVHANQASSDMNFSSCTFFANGAPNGGHLYSRNSAMTELASCILAESAEGEAFQSNGGGPVYAYCTDVTGNEGGDFVSGLDGMASMNHNFSVPPAFCDPLGGNFHLQQESPCLEHETCILVGALGMGCGFEYIVNPDGSGDFPTIAEAVNSLGHGDTILLGNGVFTGEGNRDIVINKTGLTIRSQWGDSTAVVLDCQGDAEHSHHGFFLTANSDQTTLERFTITGGYSTAESGCGLNLAATSPTVRGLVFSNNHAANGGAIFGGQESNPYVVDCVFSGNTASNAGGAISLNASGGTYEGCIFKDNAGHWAGGAMYLHSSDPDVSGCLFWGNHSDYWGGAVHGNVAQVSTFSSCTFVGNSAPQGSAFYLRENASLQLDNSILVDGVQGEAVYVKTGGSVLPASNCLDVFGNAGGDYVAGLSGLGGLPGYISLDPRFCDSSTGNFTLNFNSPCLALNNTCSQDLGAFAEGCALSGIGEDDIPSLFTLKGNYPNPFNPQTTISYGLPTADKVTLVIYDLSGYVVRRLLDQQAQPAGFHEVSWNGRDDSGRNLASGVYFYRVRAGNEDRTGKMALIR